jgi:hypothetical protein
MLPSTQNTDAIPLHYRESGFAAAEDFGNASANDTTKAKARYLIPLNSGKHSGRYESNSKLVIPLSSAAKTRVTLTIAGVSHKVVLPKAAEAGMTATLKFRATDMRGGVDIRAKFATANHDTVFKVRRAFTGDQAGALDLSADLPADAEEMPASEKYRSGLEGYALTKELTSEDFVALVDRVGRKLSQLAAFNGPVRSLIGDDQVAWKQPARGVFKQTDHMASFLNNPPNDLNEKEKALLERLREVANLNTNLNQALAAASTAKELKAVAAAGASLENKPLDGEDINAIMEAGVAALYPGANKTDEQFESILKDARIGVNGLYLAQASFKDPLQAQSLVTGLRYADEHRTRFTGPKAQQASLSLALENAHLPPELKAAVLKNFRIDSWPSAIADLAKTAKSFVTPLSYRKKTEVHKINDVAHEITYAQTEKGQCIKDKADLTTVLKAELQKRRNAAEKAKTEPGQERQRVNYADILPHQKEALDRVVAAIVDAALGSR